MKYNYDDGMKILELIQSLNQGGQCGYISAVDLAFEQYDYFKEKIKEANKNV